jgi:predicted anti-sigma-YlaC factor YlaD
LEKEPRHAFPKAARYPLFLIGLAIIIFGGLAGVYVHAADTTEAGIAAVGFIILILSVVLR